MATPIVSDDLWPIVELLVPPEPPKPQGGQPRVPNRTAPTDILFVLRSGISWEMLPAELGCGQGHAVLIMTCRGQAAGRS